MVPAFVSLFFAPFVWLSTKSTNGMLYLFRIDPKETEETVTEEDIRLMIDSGSEQGSIDSMEQEMIRNIFEFDDISLGEVCTHRRDVTFLYKDDSIEEWKNIINQTRHRYYPICGEGVDDIVAVLSASKFFHESLNHASRAVLEASEKPYFVPETMKADVLFTAMKETRNHFAIVVDEYGGTRGVITMHDLLELLVGDLGEKGYDYVEDIKKLDDGRFEIRGSALLRDVEEELGLSFDDDDYDTFGGYIFSLLDVIPEDGTQIELETEDIVIHVESIEDHRIERTIVTKKEKKETE
jgi:putative hemolysin